MSRNNVNRPIKITFLGAGSTVFAKTVLGDCMCSEPLKDMEIALYDIDATRLKESKIMLDTLNHNINNGRAKIETYLGPKNRKDALRNAKYVINAVQVGGYKPSTVIDFEIPKKYGLRQTIADTLGIGGIFRALRTIPVVLSFAHDMEQVCPEAWFINYVNPMAMVTGALLLGSKIRTVGICHSWQGCAYWLLKNLGIKFNPDKLVWKIAGINHQAWLLEVKEGNKDLYPEVRKRLDKFISEGRKKGAKKVDLVRLEIARNFGYYVTESSEHNSEYVPWFIKKTHPELIEQYGIPLDEYIYRCISQIKSWKKVSKELLYNKQLTHERSCEYASYIIESMETNVPFKFGGNVLNKGLIPNLPENACVEVPCVSDFNGIQPIYVGNLPEQCAALNRTNINVQLLTIQAALTLKKEYIYQAALLDPHTAAELTIDEIRNLCDELIEAHGDYLPKYK
jgi:alpha-galactosidase